MRGQPACPPGGQTGKTANADHPQISRNLKKKMIFVNWQRSVQTRKDLDRKGVWTWGLQEHKQLLESTESLPSRIGSSPDLSSCLISFSTIKPSPSWARAIVSNWGKSSSGETVTIAFQRPAWPSSGWPQSASLSTSMASTFPLASGSSGSCQTSLSRRSTSEIFHPELSVRRTPKWKTRLLLRSFFHGWPEVLYFRNRKCCTAARRITRRGEASKKQQVIKQDSSSGRMGMVE